MTCEDVNYPGQHCIPLNINGYYGLQNNTAGILSWRPNRTIQILQAILYSTTNQGQYSSIQVQLSMGVASCDLIYMTSPIAVVDNELNFYMQKPEEIYITAGDLVLCNQNAGSVSSFSMVVKQLDEIKQKPFYPFEVQPPKCSFTEWLFNNCETVKRYG